MMLKASPKFPTRVFVGNSLELSSGGLKSGSDIYQTVGATIVLKQLLILVTPAGS
jgi:hypothetical protein